MPKGDNPNSRKNLKPITNVKEAREKGKKGGKATAKMHAELKAFKELDKENTTNEERAKMLEMLKKRALAGNLKAFELYRDTMGMKPVQMVEQHNVEVIVEFED